MSRARLAAALAAVAVVTVPLAPAAHAVDVVKCVNDNNHIGFPYGSYYVNAQGTVTCLHGG